MNYKLEAIDLLLNENCVLNRYYPLIPWKKELIEYCKNAGVSSKEECLAKFDTLLLFKLLINEHLVMLFRHFLTMYDAKASKFTNIKNLKISDDEKTSYMSLYLLPGVKETRARLYYLAGFRTIQDFAEMNPNEMLSILERTIKDNKLNVTLPLPKEIRTHIVVAKVYTQYSV